MTELVTVQIDALTPEPYTLRLAILMHPTPRRCATFLRRKGHEQKFVLPIYIVDARGAGMHKIPNWRRSQHLRVFRPWALIQIEDIHRVVCALAYTPKTYQERGIPAHDTVVEYDESGTYTVPFTITAQEVAANMSESL